MSFLGSVSRALPSPIRERLRALVVARRDERDWRAYRAAPTVPPPHVVKVRTVLDHARRFGIDTLVETGTFEGEMARKCAASFRRVETIELDPGLAAAAARKLARLPNVRVIRGDSAAALAAVVASLEAPAVFWLDAHYSGEGTAKGDTETPLLREIAAIATGRARGHVVLVDDARLLGTGDYPTADALRDALARLDPGGGFEIRDDIARFTPPERARGAR
ncbi:MAG: hypothetical protein ACM3JJ_01115 [Hyphomicrobiales bacterium]